MTRESVREVRFAVVLYGGVSLAIYMNGIAQELLSMVRASSDLPDDDLSQVEKIYRDLSNNLDPAGPTQFVIDIISGTSAGGINGVALAKALVMGCKDMTALRTAWTDEADIGKLLNDRSRGGRAALKSDALLDGRHMYDIILNILRNMSPKENRKPLVDMVDLFVTATDLEGRPVPIQLTGTSIDERVHKSVFRFSYDRAPNGPATGGQQDRGQFGPEFDPMLAFAARCTSSFPVAFPPMRYEDIPARERNDALFSQFFGRDNRFADRAYADGGYLDNRPFSYAIDLIPFRPTALPGKRKLLFIDPFPDAPINPNDKAAPPARFEADFLKNARLAATTLPRREVIRDDLREIANQNRRLERLSALQERWDEDMVRSRPRQEKRPDDLDNLDLADLMSMDYGSAYPLYHHLRVYGTTDMLAAMVTGLAGYDSRSDESTYLRLILRAWRNENFSAYHTAGKRTENAFLSIHDLEFRLRRLNHLRSAIDKSGGQDRMRGYRRVVEHELAALRRLHQTRPDQVAQIVAQQQVDALWAGLGGAYAHVMSIPDVAGRRAAAAAIYLDPDLRPMIDAAMDGLGKRLRAGFDDSKASIEQALGDDPLIEVFRDFHWHDVTAFPFLEGSSTQEYSEVEVFRISPADSSMNNSPAKLAGIAVGAFGGFLNRDWREHDILWGRLDGAERIVTALLPAEADADRRKHYVEALQDEIIKAEYAAPGQDRQKALLIRALRDRDVSDDIRADLAAQALGVKDARAVGRKEFDESYKAFMPLGPAPKQIVGWSSRSALILSRMIEELQSEGMLGQTNRRLARGLQTSGVLTARLMHFALPGSFPRLLIDRLLFIVMIAGVLLWGADRKSVV